MKPNVYIGGYSYQAIQSVNGVSSMNQFIFNAGVKMIVELISKID
jgi:hypothetical protein